MKALKFCIIIAWMIALSVFVYSWLSEPAKTSKANKEMIWISHKMNEGTNSWIEFKPLKPLPTNLVMETDGEHFRIVDPKSPLGHWVIVGGDSQYFSSNDVIKAYWEMHEYIEQKNSKKWKEVK